MTHKTYWGLAALFIILIAAAGFVYWQWSSVQQFKEQLAREAKQLEEYQKMVTENNLPPAAPGKKWVQHDDHFHEVSIDAPNTWQEESSDTQEQSEGVVRSVAVDYPNPDNPVQVLREYAKKRGHWSAEYIPDFPPEDTEAAQVARNILIIETHIKAGNKTLYGPAEVASNENIQTFESYSGSTDQRYFDLLKLTWVRLDAPLGGDANQMFFGR